MNQTCVQRKETFLLCVVIKSQSTKIGPKFVWTLCSPTDNPPKTIGHPKTLSLVRRAQLTHLLKMCSATWAFGLLG